MALYVVATPIGNPADISHRGLKILNEVEVIIGEEPKATRKALNELNVSPRKATHFLNEHTDDQDLEALVELCQQKDVALITDCGTPGFCDPGSRLVALLRKREIAVFAVPGPASLTCFLSVCGQRIDRFLFMGFLPADKSQRRLELTKLKNADLPVILLDTPYRLHALIEDLANLLPDRWCVLSIDLTMPTERFYQGPLKQTLKHLPPGKFEFVLMVLPHPPKSHSG